MLLCPELAAYVTTAILLDRRNFTARGGARVAGVDTFSGIRACNPFQLFCIS